MEVSPPRRAVSPGSRRLGCIPLENAGNTKPTTFQFALNSDYGGNGANRPRSDRRLLPTRAGRRAPGSETQRTALAIVIARRGKAGRRSERRRRSRSRSSIGEGPGNPNLKQLTQDRNIHLPSPWLTGTTLSPKAAEAPLPVLARREASGRPRSILPRQSGRLRGAIEPARRRADGNQESRGAEGLTGKLRPCEHRQEWEVAGRSCALFGSAWPHCSRRDASAFSLRGEREDQIHRVRHLRGGKRQVNDLL